MLLVINANNTNTKFAVFDGDTMLNEWRIQTISGHAASAGRTADEYAVWLTHLMELHKIDVSQIDSCIISSVVPQTNFELKTLCRRYFKTDPLVLGEPGVQLGMEILLDRPQDAGADRIANAVGGFVALKRALIVVDFGTATTFDVVDDKGNYVGGVIAPGITLSVEALHMATAKLPRIAIERPAKIIGKDTLSAMQSGVFWGYVGLIEGLVARIKREWGSNMEVIATGGLAPLFQGSTTLFDHMMPDVTNRGLLEIWRRSQKSPSPAGGRGAG
jgi:type III pantothenate kinase